MFPVFTQLNGANRGDVHAVSPRRYFLMLLASNRAYRNHIFDRQFPVRVVFDPMQALMVRFEHHLQIIKAIISLVAIAVVDNFIIRQEATDCSLNDKNASFNVAVAIGAWMTAMFHSDISRPSKSATFPQVVPVAKHDLMVVEKTVPLACLLVAIYRITAAAFAERRVHSLSLRDKTAEIGIQKSQPHPFGQRQSLRLCRALHQFLFVDRDAQLNRRILNSHPSIVLTNVITSQGAA